MWFVIVLAMLLWFGTAQAAESDALPPFKIGMAQRTFVPTDTGSYNWRQDPKHALATLIWYPAAADVEEKAKTVGPPGRPYFDIGPVAADAPLAPSPGKFPLIALSHGFGATAANMAWLARALAAHGYIVAAVNHPGNNAIDGSTVAGATLWWLRARDLSVVIDNMLKDPTFSPRIDPRRIGAAGHSAGGYTVIELAGGITSRAHFRAGCASPEAERQCEPPPEFPDLAAQVGRLAESDPAYRTASEEVRSYRDARVRAVFAMAPGLAGAFLPESLARIAIGGPGCAKFAGLGRGGMRVPLRQRAATRTIDNLSDQGEPAGPVSEKHGGAGWRSGGSNRTDGAVCGRKRRRCSPARCTTPAIRRCKRSCRNAPLAHALQRGDRRIICRAQGASSGTPRRCRRGCHDPSAVPL